MEENLDKLFDYRPLIPGSGRFASIVGIGGGAGRVVDQMRKCCLPDVQLYAFGMNRKEMDELSLCKHSVNHVFLSPTSIINFTSKKPSYDDTRRSGRDNELLQRAQNDL